MGSSDSSRIGVGEPCARHPFSKAAAAILHAAAEAVSPGALFSASCLLALTDLCRRHVLSGVRKRHGSSSDSAPYVGASRGTNSGNLDSRKSSEKSYPWS
ncbi:Os01g0225950 [Oryza sativa Japonica Group]|uniref:Os01g0225950 protein n=1 Tax=Oryza sativa subsp. japonica TaxID=39947 RepID=A0A0P0V0C9_ORYSJ|nr:Os01g0225950 [Oryza sativa Japonica Group]